MAVFDSKIHWNLSPLILGCALAIPGRIEMLVMAVQIRLDTVPYWPYRWLAPKMSDSERKKWEKHDESCIRLKKAAKSCADSWCRFQILQINVI